MKQPHSSHHQDGVSSLVTALVLLKGEPPVDWVEGIAIMVAVLDCGKSCVTCYIWILCHTHALSAAYQVDEYDPKLRTMGKYLLEVGTLQWRLLAVTEPQVSASSQELPPSSSNPSQIAPSSSTPGRPLAFIHYTPEPQGQVPTTSNTRIFS
jgi:hypothetical protein